jgi:SpoVK/Ycf46/Vps4 family AAA+-type ATPase
MIKNLSINIDSDDLIVNEYLYCLSEFDEMPSKIAIFGNYDIQKFTDIIGNSVKKFSNREVISVSDSYVVSQKNVVKVGEIYISFIEYDKNNIGYVSDVSIYYKESSEEEANNFLNSISELLVNDNLPSLDLKIVSFSPDGVNLNDISLPEADYENIDLYYNDDVIKKTNKLIKSINKSKKGLSVIYGSRGVGKTTLVSHIIKSIDRVAIFIPSNMIDIVNTNELRNLVKQNTNSAIIIDDCELFFTNNDIKFNIMTNNILQLVDGISSDMDNLQIILVLNTDNLENIDEDLLDCNNLLDIIQVGRLTEEKSDQLCKYLNKKNKVKNPKLIDILKKRKDDKGAVKMGFY